MVVHAYLFNSGVLVDFCYKLLANHGNIQMLLKQAHLSRMYLKKRVLIAEIYHDVSEY